MDENIRITFVNERSALQDNSKFFMHDLLWDSYRILFRDLKYLSFNAGAENLFSFGRN